MSEIIIKETKDPKIIKQNVFGYARISKKVDGMDKEQLERTLRNQFEIIENDSKLNNYNLIKIFYDRDLSGSDFENRDDFNKMISLSKKGEASLILVADDKRFARDPAYFIIYLRELIKAGIRVKDIARQKIMHPEDFDDQVLAMVSGGAVTEGRKKYEQWFDRYVALGKPIITPIFGYKWKEVKNKQELKSWEIVPKKAEIVKKVFELKDKKNYKEICKELGIYPVLLYRILNNERIYKGELCVKKSIKDRVKLTIPEIIWYKGIHPPIL